MELLSFKEEHIEEAAGLVRSGYKELHTQEPLLPQQYQELYSFHAHLEDILKYGNPGVAAFDGGKLVGFLIGWQMSDFRGKGSVYCPEWGHSAVQENRKYIYEEMYRKLAADWVANKLTAHYISFFSHDKAVMDIFHWLGFGMLSVDAVRSLDEVESAHTEIEIRLAELEDVDGILELQNGMARYMKKSPDFFIYDPDDREYYENWVTDPKTEIWLAFENGEPVSYIKIGPANEDVCAIIVDDKTTSISGAYTKEEYHGMGIGTAVLARAIAEAKNKGYERCAVDFESTNPSGARFWLGKKFRPVCLSLVRFVDERVL